jgi:hypothetical protein
VDGGGTYLLPLPHSLPLTLLEKALVVRNAVFAVDESVPDIESANLLMRQFRQHPNCSPQASGLLGWRKLEVEDGRKGDRERN